MAVMLRKIPASSISKVQPVEEESDRIMLAAECKVQAMLHTLIGDFNESLVHINPTLPSKYSLSFEWMLSTYPETPGLAINNPETTYLVDFGKCEHVDYWSKGYSVIRYGILTPLLPNWPRPFLKFSGANGEFQPFRENWHGGRIDEEDWVEVSEVLQGFTHLSWVMSNEGFIVADLQGSVSCFTVL